MSQKVSKSKSKQKAADKPPKDGKAKKQKGDDTKSKKSVDKQSKKQKLSAKKEGSKVNQSKIQNQQKSIIDQSQIFWKPIIDSSLLDQSLCQYHKQKNTMFCQICQQPGCRQCLLYGPHNNQMHRINKLDEAFKARYLYLNQLVCTDLIQKRQQTNKKMGQLTVASDQLRYVKNGIQKITKNQYNEMLQRLRTSSGGKFAILHHEMAQLQKDLESLNSLAHEFKDITNVQPELSSVPPNNPPKGMVSFLLRYKYLQQQAQQLISKPIKTSVDVYPYDLPRQLTQKKMILEKNKKWVQLLEIKDEAIWSLVQQKKSLQRNLWTDFQNKLHVQLQQWSKLKQDCSSNLQAYNMCCKKCQIHLNADIINDTCTVEGYHDFN